MMPQAPRQWRPALRGLLSVLLLTVLVYLVVVSWRTVRHAASLKAHVSELRRQHPADLSSLGGKLAAVRDDLVALRSDLALPLAVASHLGWIPRYGTTIRAAPTFFDFGETMLDAIIQLWGIAGEPLSVDPGGGGGEASPLSEAARRLTHEQAALIETAARVRQACDQLQSIDAGRTIPMARDALAKVQELTPIVTLAFDLLPVLSPVINSPEEHTFLVLAQNNEELRPTGGFLSSFGTLVLGKGSAYLGPFEDSYRLEDWDQPHPDPPEPYRTYMGLDLWVTRDGNWWPDFPTSARAVSDLYALNRKRTIEGVLAFDMLAAQRMVDTLAPLALGPGRQVLPGQADFVFRQSWSLPAGSLVNAGVMITATNPFTSIELSLTYSHKQGRAWFDAVTLEDLRRPGVNLVSNPSFEQDADGDNLPDAWLPNGLVASDRLVSDAARDGQRSLLVLGDPEGAKSSTQRVALVGEKGVRIKLAAESRAEDANIEGGPYALIVSFLSGENRVQTVTLSFPVLTHDWASAGTAEVLGRWWNHRKDFMEETLNAALGKMMVQPGAVEWLDLLGAARDLLDEHHIQLFASDQALQSLIRRHGWGGELGAAPGDSLLVVDTNMGYNKVTPMVRQTVAYDVALDGSGSARCTLTLSYFNGSNTARPECDKYKQYVPTYDALTQGCYWDYVRVYVPDGSALVSARGGDEPTVVISETGYTVFCTYFMLRPGEARQLSFEYTLPDVLASGDAYTLSVRKQAGTVAIPLTITVTVPEVAPFELSSAGGNVIPSAKGGVMLVYATDLRVDRWLKVHRTRRMAGK